MKDEGIDLCHVKGPLHGVEESIVLLKTIKLKEIIQKE